MDNNAVYANGKEVGRFVTADGDVWLYKGGLDPRRHMLKQPPAWAIAQEHLDELRHRGGAGVRLFLITGRSFEATLDDFDQYGFDIRRGVEAQIGLTLNRWREIDYSRI